MTDTTPQGSILLIDDDKFLLDMYAMKFSREGFAVQSSLSAPDALTLLRQGTAPDVILFDLTMPGMDGYAFLEALRTEKLAPTSIKIALTNQSSDAEKKRVTDLGADIFIVKATMIPSEVVSAVRDALKAHTHK